VQELHEDLRVVEQIRSDDIVPDLATRRRGSWALGGRVRRRVRAHRTPLPANGVMQHVIAIEAYLDAGEPQPSRRGRRGARHPALARNLHRLHRFGHEDQSPRQRRRLRPAARLAEPGRRPKGGRAGQRVLDAVVIGSGPNWLVSANILADHGWSVEDHQRAGRRCASGCASRVRTSTSRSRRSSGGGAPPPSSPGPSATARAATARRFSHTPARIATRCCAGLRCCAPSASRSSRTSSTSSCCSGRGRPAVGVGAQGGALGARAPHGRARRPAPPWPELAHLHFNDPLAYFAGGGQEP
jgi:hypothetical protein